MSVKKEREREIKSRMCSFTAGWDADVQRALADRRCTCNASIEDSVSPSWFLLLLWWRSSSSLGDVTMLKMCWESANLLLFNWGNSPHTPDRRGEWVKEREEVTSQLKSPAGALSAESWVRRACAELLCGSVYRERSPGNLFPNFVLLLYYYTILYYFF